MGAQLQALLTTLKEKIESEAPSSTTKNFSPDGIDLHSEIARASSELFKTIVGELWPGGGSDLPTSPGQLWPFHSSTSIRLPLNDRLGPRFPGLRPRPARTLTPVVAAIVSDCFAPARRTVSERLAALAGAYLDDRRTARIRSWRAPVAAGACYRSLDEGLRPSESASRVVA